MWIFGEINRTAFEIFGLPIYWYGIIIVSGIIVAITLASQEAVKVGMKADDVMDFALLALLIGIFGARLYYVIFNWQDFADDPAQIILGIRDGGLGIYGGLIAGAITMLVFSKRRGINIWTFLDVAAPSVMIAQAIGRWGNFTNHEAFGKVVSRGYLEGLHLPNFIIDNMYIDDAYRQPTFLYESLWNILGFILILWLRSRKKLFKRGEVFFSYIIWYSFGRYFIEGMRTDSLMIGDLRVSQGLSLLLFVGGIVCVVWRRKKYDLPYYDRSFQAEKTR